ncbi:NAD-dependent DNA ligase LigA [Desulfobacterales bacterium HSG16]|nr:NAD-dependent DNA ligase LigA [Desulfobacterales bacterium HSG16]
MRYTKRVLSFFLICVITTGVFAANIFASNINLDRKAALEKIQKLSFEVKRHNHLYYVLGRPEISDVEYNRLFNELAALEKKYPDLVLPDSPTKRVGAALADDFSKVRHITPMLSLEKCYSTREIISWAEKVRKKSGKKLSFVAEEKIDGTGIELIYIKGAFSQALTRGDGTAGYDVSKNVRAMAADMIPMKLKQPVSVTVRGEIFIKKTDFVKYGKDKFSSARNLAAGILRRQKVSEMSKIPLNIFIFEAAAGIPADIEKHDDLLAWLDRLGFNINHHNRTFTNLEKLSDHIKKADLQRHSLNYDIDGIVIKVNERSIRKMLGTTERFPKWAIAYKFGSPVNRTILESIDVKIGRSGKLTPVARLRPVKIGGTTIKSATLHNQDYINRLQIAVCDIVKVSRRGNVIPAIDQVMEKNKVGNSTWQISEHCPVCKSVLKVKGKHHYCLNKECSGRVLAKLIYFAGTMKIRHLGEKTVEMFFNEKLIRYPEDIYALKAEDIKALKGFGSRKTKALLASIEQSKDRPFHTVLASLGIEALGTKNIKILLNAGFDSVDTILNAEVSGLLHLKGIGKENAQKIISGFDPRIKKSVEALEKAGLKIR